MRLSRKGFTLVELVVISPIIIFAIGYTMGFLVDLYINTNELVAKLNLKSDAQNILYRIQDDLFYAKEFADQLPVNSTDSDEKNDAPAPTSWSDDLTSGLIDLQKGSKDPGSYAFLIATYPATDKPRGESERKLIYTIPTEGGICGESGYLGFDFLLDSSVYYFRKMNDNTARVYRRIVNQTAPYGTCPDNDPDLVSYQQTTFNPDSASNPKDSLVADKVNRVEVTLFDDSDNVVDDYSLATKAKLKITLEGLVNGETFTESNEVTMKRAN